MAFAVLLLPVFSAVFINGYLGNRLKIVGYLTLIIFCCIIAGALGTFFNSDTIISIGYIISVLSVFIIIICILVSIHQKLNVQMEPLAVGQDSYQSDDVSGASGYSGSSDAEPAMPADQLASYSTELKRLLKNLKVTNGLQFQTLAKKRIKDIDNFSDDTARVVVILNELSNAGLKIRTIGELNTFFKMY